MTIYTSRDTSGLAQGIGILGEALGQAFEAQNVRKSKEMERQKQLQKYGLLADVMSQIDMNDIQGQQELLQQGLRYGALDEAINMVKIYQTTQSQRPLTVEETDGFSRILKGLGIPDPEADNIAELYGKSNVGGRTEIIKLAVDRAQRSSRYSPNSAEPIEESADVEPESTGFQFPKIDIAPGLTPKEKVAREKELFNSNSKDYNDITQKAKSLKDESLRVNLLKRYNESGKLPEGMERLNINWATGDIRVPALANAETQAFVKTINDFTTKAKETFGARVTNFELGAFLRRLPTLANTTEGRRLIIEQMQAMNDINQLYEDSIKEVYDHYGLRGVDRQQAEVIAADIRAEKEAEAKERYENSIYAQDIFESKMMAPEGMAPVQKPDGTIGYLRIDQLDKASAKGYKIL